MTPKKLDQFKSNIQITESGCHLWTGTVDTHGYGSFYTGDTDRPTVKVHRWWYEYTHGVELDPWSAVRHYCNKRTCVNVDHLYIHKDRVLKPRSYINRQRGPRPHTWKQGPDPVHKQMNMSFLRMRAQCKFRKEPFHLTFQDYQEIWQDSWSQRGRTEGSLNMTRRDYMGEWTRDNVHLVVRRKNLEPWRARARMATVRKKQMAQDKLNTDGSGG